MERKDFKAQRAKTLFATKPSSRDLKNKRAYEYATPRHNARTTKEYSVSFPVWIVWSQLSNVSTSGQIRQISRANATVIRDARDSMASSIAHRPRGTNRPTPGGGLSPTPSSQGCSQEQANSSLESVVYSNHFLTKYSLAVIDYCAGKPSMPPNMRRAPLRPSLSTS